MFTKNEHSYQCYSQIIYCIHISERNFSSDRCAKFKFLSLQSNYFDRCGVINFNLISIVKHIIF